MIIAHSPRLFNAVDTDIIMRMNRKRLLCIGFCLLLAGAGLLVAQNSFSQKTFDSSAVSRKMTHPEFEEKSAYFQEKLEKEGIISVFQDLERQALQDPVVARECHPLLHRIGHGAFKKYGTFDAAISYQNGLCNSGYTHGVIEATFLAAEDPGKTIATTCKPGTDFYAWQCFHGLGHGAMLTSKRSVERSIDLCMTLPAGFESQACINGVFMERFLSMDHSGAMRSDTTDAAQVCAEQEIRDKPDCYFYAPTYFLGHHSNDYSGAATWCHTNLKEYVSACILGVGAQTMKENVTNPSLVADFCATLEGFADTCVGGAVNILINHYASSSKVAELCGSSFKEFEETCIKTVTQVNKNLNI